MVKIFWGSLPIIGISILTFTTMDGSVSVAERLNSPGCRDEVISTGYQGNRAADVFEPREDNEGQPQETVG